MSTLAHHIPIVAEPAAAGCGGCSDEGLPCAAIPAAETCADPELRGDPELLRRALASLREVVDPAAGRNLVEMQLVRSLRIGDGEAELMLTFAPRCGSARALAEDAFDRLRSALPETDVYVRHAA